MEINKKIFTLFFIFCITSNSFAQDDLDAEFEAYEKEFSSKTVEEIYDPFEKINRKIFYFNDKLDFYFIAPIAKGYRNYAPNQFQKSVHNFTNNLTLPLSAINSFAQGKGENGLATFSTFLINSTIGILGLFDVAGAKNIRYEKEDFGQTLGHYDITSGAYIVIPVLGPSNLRDFSGRLFDSSVDLMGFNMIEIGGSRDAVVNDDFRVANALFYSLDKRTDLIDIVDESRKDSFDLYATMRSYYTQHRNSKIDK